MNWAEFVRYYGRAYTEEDCEKLVAGGVAQCLAGVPGGKQNLDFWQLMLARRKVVFPADTKDGIP